MACFGHKFLNRVIQFFSSKIFVANVAFGIDQIGSWPTGDIPFCCDRTEGALFAVPETTPIDIQLFNRFTRDFDFFVAIDSDQSKWLTCQLFYERPLV